MIVIDHADVELSLEIVKQWSDENAANDLDWKRVHSAANILALAQYRGAQHLAKLRERVNECKQRVKQAEAMAKLTALGLLLSGRATLPDGYKLTDGTSYSVAKDLSVSFIPNDPAVIQATAELLKAEGQLIAWEQKLDALREISQGAKSTAKLMQEIG